MLHDDEDTKWGKSFFHFTWAALKTRYLSLTSPIGDFMAVSPQAKLIASGGVGRWQHAEWLDAR